MMTSKIIFYVLFLPLVLVTAGSQNGDIVRIPLGHMESGLEKLFSKGASLNTIEGIYNMHKKIQQPMLTVKNGKPTPSNATLPLFKYFDTNYYGIVNIGKPGHAFNMIMDTAWTYTWVPSKECPRTSLPCARHNKYDHDGSSTYIPDGKPFNISGRYVGYFSKDTFLVGQMYSKNQTFAELSKIPWINALYETDGTIGLGLKDLAPDVLPFFYNFYQQNSLKQPIFSFYINRDPTTPTGGSLFFGGIDYKHNKTEFHPIPINSPYYWQFAMDRVTLIQSKKKLYDFCKQGCTALADTSSNTIVGPPDEIRRINTLIGADEVFFSDRYLIPCVNEFKGPKINFTIGKKEFQIVARDYIQKLSYSGLTVCLSAFVAAEPTYPKNTWILGGAFLYQYYTAFDISKRQILIADVA